MLYLLILMPLAGIIILNLPMGNFMRRAAFWFALLIFSVQICASLFHWPAGWTEWLDGRLNAFFHIQLSMDSLTRLVFLAVGIVSTASLLVGKACVKDEREQFNFINLLIISSIGMSGIIMVRDVFSLYVFLEITAVSAFILIAHQRERKALEGAFKYIMLSAIATILMLAGIGLFLLISGDTSFAAIKEALANSPTSALARFAIGLFIAGLFIKGGLVPFHGWLPDAYSSSSAPVAVLLAGIVTKVSGIYTLLRLVTSLFGFDAHIKAILLLTGAVSILAGALGAIKQNNFKRMLAYSSISQVGYIILGFGTGTALGVFGAAFHLFNHAIFKSLLFVNSAAVESQTGTVNMDELGGLSSRMPVTGATSLIAFLSTSGIPPLAGFWSKLIIIIALWTSGHFAYAAIAVLAGVLTLAYLLLMQRKVFFGTLRNGLDGIKEAPMPIQLASIALALVTIGTGLFFPVVFETLILPVEEILR